MMGNNEDRDEDRDEDDGEGRINGCLHRREVGGRREGHGTDKGRTPCDGLLVILPGLSR
jgi:hypothetical protein